MNQGPKISSPRELGYKLQQVFLISGILDPVKMNCEIIPHNEQFAISYKFSGLHMSCTIYPKETVMEDVHGMVLGVLAASKLEPYIKDFDVDYHFPTLRVSVQLAKEGPDLTTSGIDEAIFHDMRVK